VYECFAWKLPWEGVGKFLLYENYIDQFLHCAECSYFSFVRTFYKKEKDILAMW
jgi:hypothetical protein